MHGCPRREGARNVRDKPWGVESKVAGAWLQVALVVTLSLSVPVAMLWTVTGPATRGLFGASNHIANMASYYAIVLATALPGRAAAQLWQSFASSAACPACMLARRVDTSCYVFYSQASYTARSGMRLSLTHNAVPNLPSPKLPWSWAAAAAAATTTTAA
ncbi:protein detoxification [Pycnococcus provasolii]